MASISLKTGVVRKPTYDIDKLLATDDDTDLVSSDTPTERRTVSSDTPTERRTVSSDTSRQIRYKNKLSRIVLDYRIEESELIRKEASEQGIKVSEHIRRA